MAKYRNQGKKVKEVHFVPSYLMQSWHAKRHCIDRRVDSDTQSGCYRLVVWGTAYTNLRQLDRYSQKVCAILGKVKSI